MPIAALDDGFGEDPQKFDDLSRHFEADQVIFEGKAVENSAGAHLAKVRQKLQVLGLKEVAEDKLLNCGTHLGIEQLEIEDKGALVANFDFGGRQQDSSGRCSSFRIHRAGSSKGMGGGLRGQFE